MDKARSIGVGAVVGAVFTHGMVFTAMHLNELLPFSTYQGFFQRMLFATERLWSYAHGWQPMSHISDFGRFYAETVHLICPLIGFALFWIVSRYKVGTKVWKPLAIALLLTIPASFGDLASVYAVPWLEAARTVLVVLLMVWSVGAIKLSMPHISPTELLATA